MEFIKMCVLMFSLSLISLSYAQDSIVYKTVDEMHSQPGENFLPLAMGNGWQLMFNYNYTDIYGQYYHYRGIYSIAVTDTTHINGKLYYKIDQSSNLIDIVSRQYYLRIDKVNNKVYKTLSLTPINEFLYFDFNLTNGTPYLQGDQIVNAYNTGSERGFTGITPRWYVSKNIGFYDWHEDIRGPVETCLIDAFVKDTNASYIIRDPEFDPQWNVSSLTNTINSDKWHIRLSAEHYIIELGSSFSDYISMHSYYKRGNDSISNAAIRFSNASVDTTITLDSSLLAQNYKFYYRFDFKNKFVQPMHFYYPQAGYNTLTYISDVKNENLKKMNYSLEQNYPNPFNPSTNIKYYVPFESRVNITIYNALGSKVKEIISENKSQGNYEVKFDGTGLASGIYFATLKAASVDGKQSFIGSKKIILIK